MPPESLEHARELVLKFGWNSTGYQILNPGFVLWFSSSGDAVVGYVRHNGVRVVGGAPICSKERLPAVAEAFENEASKGGERVCYFGAGDRLEHLYRGASGYAEVTIGGEPVWDPHDWTKMVARHSSLRAQLHRARNKGVSVSEWPAERARNNPELRRCLNEWLRTRGLPPLHFMVETDTLSRIFDRRCFIAERKGTVAGFLIASPIPQRKGWLVEQIVRGDHAVNGTNELMLDAAMHALIDSGSEYVTLGLAPLSRQAGSGHGDTPVWLSVLLAWMRAHGRRFYNFRGLEAFKAKFRPARWDPVYAIVNEPQFSPVILYAIAGAFASGSPLALIAGALWQAFTQEVTTAASHATALVSSHHKLPQ
ncbi:MAG TPA: DUF2156 domain-containing protein [Rhodothermales bacterium]|nr:DUF2156 domain-containing protein [Rhodothermales bacterium]